MEDVMKKVIFALLVVSLSALLSACAGKTVTPIAPQNVDLLSHYRKNVEVRVVDCQHVNNKSYRHREEEYKTLVEATVSGERFYVWGCVGSRGDKFYVTY
jgi:hypothetical protein